LMVVPVTLKPSLTVTLTLFLLSPPPFFFFFFLPSFLQVSFVKRFFLTVTILGPAQQRIARSWLHSSRIQQGFWLEEKRREWLLNERGPRTN
ncbi:hypothetical protein VIGAN_11095800, partial [Vigna angularis var. angularis]